MRISDTNVTAVLLERCYCIFVLSLRGIGKGVRREGGGERSDDPIYFGVISTHFSYCPLDTLVSRKVRLLDLLPN